MNLPILIPAANPGALTGSGNNTWLLPGKVPTLIDAGVGAPAHLDTLAAHLGGVPLQQVLVTHGHADHASGALSLCERWPDLRICKWRLKDETEWLPLADGERVPAGDTMLTVVHTPGHAPDHVCFWEPETRSLYSGDMVVQGTTVMIPAGRGGNLRQYLDSLERIRALRPERIYPGHGPVIERADDLIAEYLAHRQMRETQVLECLRDNITDIEQIVDHIYPGLDEQLRGAARLTVEAHLEKLREDMKGMKT